MYPWVNVDSSWVRAVRFVPAGLEMRTLAGRIYLYPGVSERLYRELLASASKGTFINAKIKRRFVGREVY